MVLPGLRERGGRVARGRWLWWVAALGAFLLAETAHAAPWRACVIKSVSSRNYGAGDAVARIEASLVESGQFELVSGKRCRAWATKRGFTAQSVLKPANLK